MNLFERKHNRSLRPLSIFFEKWLYNRLVIYFMALAVIVGGLHGFRIIGYWEAVISTAVLLGHFGLFVFGTNIEQTLRRRYQRRLLESEAEGLEPIIEVTATENLPNIYKGATYPVITEKEDGVIVENELGGKTKLDSSEFTEAQPLKQTG